MAAEWGVGEAKSEVEEEIRAEDLSVPSDLCSNINLKAAEFNEVPRPRIPFLPVIFSPSASSSSHPSRCSPALPAL
jgi:hypothetical protein